MASHGANTKVDRGEIVERLFQCTSREQVKQLIETAMARSGEVIANAAYEPGDDVCLTFKFPFPPQFDQFCRMPLPWVPGRAFSHMRSSFRMECWCKWESAKSPDNERSPDDAYRPRCSHSANPPHPSL